MLATRMPTAIQEKSTGSGEKIFSTEDFISSRPIRMMMMEMIRPVMYSARPWPNG